MVAHFGLIPSQPQGPPESPGLDPASVENRESSYHLSPVPIWPGEEMPGKLGTNRRGPTAADASVGGRGGEEEREEKRDKRKETVSHYSVTSGNHIHILCTLIFIFYSLLYIVRLILSELQEPLCQSLGKHISKQRTTD